ncbi:MAG TPA: phage holin family protein [Thermomicrobiales bacterium]|nr:phage holin family protein [Thermomicrobiales bacterium]
MQQSRDDRSLGELFSELSRQTSTLIRQEVALAKAEMKQKGSEAGKDIGMMAAGGALAYAGLLALIAMIIIVLANVMPWWLSALIVGSVVVAIGGLMIQRGMSSLKESGVAPEQTIETLKEDKEWAKKQLG